MAALPTRLARLCEQWGLVPGRVLPGGSASYVVRARTSSGAARVLKVLVPDPDLADEARVLAAADGVGYARLFEHDKGALLLEELGPSLERSGLGVEATLSALADTLVSAWEVPLAVVSTSSLAGARSGSTSGGRPPDKAASLLAGIEANAAHVPAELRRRVTPAIEVACETARGLAASYDPDRAVVVHGDPHPGNLLRRGPGEWAFVDPDGFGCEREYDLGVALRDFSRRVLEAPSDLAARRLVAGWAGVLAERTGTDAERVVAWGLVERVSTGLYVCSIGSPRVGVPFLDSATRLVGHP